MEQAAHAADPGRLRSRRARGGVLAVFMFATATPTLASVAHAVQVAVAPWRVICTTSPDPEFAAPPAVLGSTVARQRPRGAAPGKAR